ncbi:prolyl oligopeptidase family serine peptidase [Corynebacterium sp. A21]|uniref:prolyl oligopeptidase family serine peptidase n=1 Tax=Corynebacterium sp. A21 TaxID=3457318 RepID=UPI003FD6A3B3
MTETTPTDFHPGDTTPDQLLPIDSEEALNWAKAWSQRTEDSVAADPLRAQLQERILTALDSDDRIAYVSRRGDTLFNFWRDAAHPRGLWRTTDLASYLSGDPEWRVLIDVDALAAEEDENWVWKGAVVRRPATDRALIRLSRGGADAVVVREFDLLSGAFITENAFALPEAKSDLSWVDIDTLLVGTDTGENALTTSGYPAQVRRWHRGTPVAQAPLVAAGEREDVAIGAHVDPTPGFERITVTRALDFYRARTWVGGLSGELREIEVPEDCEVLTHLQWLFLLPREEYAGIPAGGLGVIELEAFLAGSREVAAVFTPDAGTALQSLAFTEHHLVLTLLNNVSTEILVLPLEEPTGEQRRIDLPELVTASVVATASLDGDEIWLNASSFTEPATLYRLDLATSLSPEAARRAPVLFDAAGMDTRQHWATSADGTKIPYFITGVFDGSARPTLVGGYGGFEVSLTPGYAGVKGLALLERGWFTVIPNLRGGGEFGPQWHSQAVKTNRVKVFEDHRAVIEDLHARGYTTPELTTIRGGSNGGLLTSAALTRMPELLGAAVIQVPLTDMLRYHTWSAGASWMAEYGDPDIAEERAVIETYSPLHNVSPREQREYPPALVTTSTRDDRVHPAHARLFARELAVQGHPVEYHENTEGGHAGAADNTQVAAVESLIYAWLISHVPSQVGSADDE